MKAMTRTKLLVLLRRLSKSDDPEEAHVNADDALIAFINDAEIADAYSAIAKWYA